MNWLQFLFSYFLENFDIILGLLHLPNNGKFVWSGRGLWGKRTRVNRKHYTAPYLVSGLGEQLHRHEFSFMCLCSRSIFFFAKVSIIWLLVLKSLNNYMFFFLFLAGIYSVRGKSNFFLKKFQHHQKNKVHSPLLCENNTVKKACFGWSENLV